MLPPIAIVDSIEMIRDGGSLGALFRGPDAAQYSLLLGLVQQQLPDGRLERLGYCDPAIIDRQTGIRTCISWLHAGILLGEMRSLVDSESHLKWLEVMAEVVDQEGRLPSGIARFIGHESNATS